jgi:hypothetical protein
MQQKNRLKMKGIGGHQKVIGTNDEWLTPPELIKQLGEFDLDPCAPVVRPWPTAKQHYTIDDNGLLLEWNGRVWLNPPYNRYHLPEWLQKMALHNNGILLMFARTETVYFQDHVFEKADSIFFLKGRLTFYDVNGKKAPANGGAPSILAAYGERNVDALDSSGLEGRHVLLNTVPIMVVGVSPTWKAVINIALNRLNGEAQLQKIYDLVEQIAPDKVQNNKHFKEKIRQKLQQFFPRKERGTYSLFN